MARPPAQPFATDLSDEAVALLAQVPTPHERSQLRGFLGFLSKTGRSLTEVGARDLELYEHALVALGVKRQHQAARNAAAAWARMQLQEPAWPQTPLPMPENRRPRSADDLDLPVSFHADVEAYLGRASGNDLFDKRRSKPLAPATLVNMRRKLYRLAFMAVETGIGVGLLTSLAVYDTTFVP